MPAKRIPWFKLWIGATAHGKVRQLDDSSFRTWVELLDAASQQPTRGRFANAREAAAITRRPAKHVATLMSAGLIDERDDGLWMHDWEDWQRWRPEDANDTPTTTEHPPNGHLNNSRTTTEPLGNDPVLRARVAKEERREKREVEEDVNPPSSTAPEGGTRPAVPKPKKEHLPVDDGFIDVLISEYGAKMGGPGVVREEIDAALNHTASTKCLDQRMYLRTWLNRDVRRGPIKANMRPIRPVDAPPEVPADSPFLQFREVS